MRTANVDCLCPPNEAGEVRHPDGDSIHLRERLDYRQAATVQHAVTAFRMTKGEDEDIETEEILGILTEAYIRYGVEAWSLVDEKGEPRPVTPTNVGLYLLTDVTAAMIVGDEADGLYSGAILLPLLKRASTSSQDGPTPDTTSPPTGSSPTTAEPTPLRPSSTSTTQTDDTATTSPSPDGDSKSSPSTASVA